MNRQRKEYMENILDAGTAMQETETVKAENTRFRDIINDHLQLIERQCFKAVRQQFQAAALLNSDPINIENEALELSSQVMDTLQRNDYHVLRQFKGNAKLSTYITAIIARHAVDMIRKKRGRSRQKERAQKFGDIGLWVYEKLVKQGCPTSKIHEQLKKEKAISHSPEEIRGIADKIAGNNKKIPVGPAVREGTTIKSENRDTFVVPDNRHNPSQLMEDSQRSKQVNQALKTILQGLNGEERLVLKMRFREGEKSGKIGIIANLLGITEKAAYKRIARVLKKCRTLLQQQGVNIHDLL